MNRRQLFQAAGGGLATLALPRQPTAASSSRRPNLLFLLTDQQRQDTLRVYGNSRIIVPNLNRLADQSIVFTKYYVSQPLCTPSRGSLLSGLYPHTDGSTTNNIPLNRAVPSLVEMLKSDEYVTAYYGKWHLGNELCPQHGFTYFESTEDIYTRDSQKTCSREHSGYYDFLASHGQTPDSNGEFSREFANSVPKELSKPAYLALKAGQFLEDHRHTPWVMYVSFLDPHTPFHSANDHLYDPATLEVPKPFFEKQDPTELDRTKAIRKELLRSKRSEEMLSTPDDLRKVKARYWGKITLVDEMIGKLLRRLDALGLAETTLVVFSSDHGEMMGDHRLMFKSVMYEQAIKVPMLLRIPWLKGQPPRITRCTSEVDVVPTLLELMGQSLPRHLQGRSWAPYLLGRVDFPDRDVVVEWNGSLAHFKNKYAEPLRTIIAPDGWKMTLAPRGEGELFNLAKDPHEEKNIFYEKESLITIRALAEEINLWQRSTGDVVLSFDESGWEHRRIELGRFA